MNKPDFEKLARDAFEEERPGNMAMWTAKEDDEEVVYWRNTFKKGAEKIWNDYVVPLQSVVPSSGKSLCEGCQVNEPWEHRCFQKECTCETCLRSEMYGNLLTWLQDKEYPTVGTYTHETFTDTVLKYMREQMQFMLIRRLPILPSAPIEKT